MGKIKIKRKAYDRKAYTRKDGTKVRASHVPGSNFKVRDRGKPGRTPRSEQFYNPQVKMGWKKNQPARTRRAKALRSHGGDTLATARALQALANVTTDRKTRELASADARYFFRRHNAGR